MLPSRLSKKYAKMARSRQLFWLVDWTLDVYLFYIVFGLNSRDTVPLQMWRMEWVAVLLAAGLPLSSAIANFVSYRPAAGNTYSTSDYCQINPNK